MLIKLIDKFKCINEDINKVDKKIIIKKDNFDKEWDKWGTKKMVERKIP